MGWLGAGKQPPPGCVRCRAMEVPLAQCPYCGTPAGDLLARSRPVAPPSLADQDDAIERQLRIWAVPAVFALAGLIMQSGTWRSLVRTFLSMWLHELGHALSAWMTGYGALPGPWRTSVSDHRSLLVTLVIVVVCGGLGYRTWAAERRILPWVFGAIAALAVAGAVLLSPTTATMLFTFGGDAGMMLLGAGLVLTFWARVGSHLHTSWLRWGFLVIGAFAVLDGVMSWWPARSDPSVIAYGEIEGVGLSDPTKLVDRHHWTQHQLINRYCAVAVIAVALILGRYLVGLWQIRRERLARP